MDGAERAQSGWDGPTRAASGVVAEPVPARIAQAARDENFPVVVRLTPRRLAAPIRAFYAFARGADDVADDPALSSEAKLDRLDAYGAGLYGSGGHAAGRRLAAALAGHPQRDRAIAAAATLLDAFRQDARGADYPDWAALSSYCERSADPVGRFLLAVHDEGRDAEAASDALCTALQVLNHMQDLRADRDRMGRVYMPRAWLADDALLSRPDAAPPVRAALDRALDECDRLLTDAAPLPRLIRSPSLRAQAAATLHLARRLARRLRTGDPLAARIKPSRGDVAAGAARGLWAAVRG